MMPENISTEMLPSSSSVVAALRDFGFRNAGTPLLMASTPVSGGALGERAQHQQRQREAGERVALGEQLDVRALGQHRLAVDQDAGQAPHDHAPIPKTNA